MLQRLAAVVLERMETDKDDVYVSEQEKQAIAALREACKRCGFHPRACGDCANYRTRRALERESGLNAAQPMPVPEEFTARTLGGKLITGEQRYRLYQVFSKSIDRFLEEESEEAQP